MGSDVIHDPCSREWSHDGIGIGLNGGCYKSASYSRRLLLDQPLALSPWALIQEKER